MDPQDSTEIDSRCSKRRISSILKAPQKSIRYPEPEQQENQVVEGAKTVEKRNSRRVSFAPTNNVLLFSSDVKNGSPAQNPLQELMTTSTATQNGVQVAVSEDGIQQITGMETLLNAPLHMCQQRDKVNFNIGNDFGEKTVMFSTDDAFMDMTHSQTINIANDADILADMSLQNVPNVFPACRERTVLFTADDGSMDMTLNHTVNSLKGSVPLPASKTMDSSAEIRNISSSAPCVDRGFEDFLASLFKSSGPSVNPAVASTAGASSGQSNSSPTRVKKTQKAYVDKENQVPKSVSAVGEKLLNTLGRIGEPSCVSPLYPEDDISMDMTEAQTSHIQGFTGNDNPFHRVHKTLPSFNPKDMISMKSPLRASHQRREANLDIKDGCREKTIMFSADYEFMDMTQSHTVNITNAPTHGLPGSSTNGLDLGFENFLASLSKPSASGGKHTARTVTPPLPAAAASSEETVNTKTPVVKLKTNISKVNQSRNRPTTLGKCFNGGPGNNASIDLTAAQTGPIKAPRSSDDPFQFLLPSQDVFPHCESLKGQKTSDALGPSNGAGLETSFKPSLQAKLQRQEVKFDAEDDRRDKTVRFSADDACMDVTQSHTVNIATDFATQDLQPHGYQVKKVEMNPWRQHSEALGLFSHKDSETLLAASSKMKVQTHQVMFDAEDDCRDKTVRFTADKACMDVTQSHTVNIVCDLEMSSDPNVDFLPACGEKTVRFTANDAAMDVTQSHTVNIATGFDLKSQQNVDFLPACGEKTVRFSANDAAMDVTKSHTVNIATGFDLQSQGNVDFLPACGEKTVRFDANDAAMDVTKSHTVNIATGLDLKSQQNVDFLPACGEKTVRFDANDAAMDVTQSHSVNIATGFGLQSHRNVDFLPACGEKTVRFDANDAAMDVTKSHTVNIATGLDLQPNQNVDFLPLRGKKTARLTLGDTTMDVTGSQSGYIACQSARESLLPHRDSNLFSLRENTDRPLSVKKRDRSSGLSRMSGPWVNPTIIKAAPTPPSLHEAGDTIDFQVQLKTDTDKELSFVSPVGENPVNKSMADCPEDDMRMEMTEPQTGRILGHLGTDEPPSSTLGLFPESQNIDSPGSSKSEGVEITNHTECPGTDETDNSKVKNSSPSAADHVDAAPSRKSRRMSLADIHSKIRRLCHGVTPETMPVDGCTAPLPQLEDDMDKNPTDQTKPLPLMEPGLDVGAVNTEENTQAQCPVEGELTVATTPFKLQTKQLMSRLSVGGFKPKLPRRSKADDPKKAGEPAKTVTVNVTKQLSSFDADVSDIYAEELGSCEDMSEMLDMRSPQKGKVGPPQENVFEEDSNCGVQGEKRPLSANDNSLEDEKRMMVSPETAAEFEMSGLLECDATTAPCVTTQTIDYSTSTDTASVRCEATSESTLKQSLLESQLEDYASDMQRKFDDGTITVLEFFKVFNIDFVIHNPRQSVLPNRHLSDMDHMQMDLLKDKHINRPKQRVYETHVLTLTDKVEGLKVRMQDLDRPLKMVNRSLWEELRNASEQELKSFGTKLKERHNLFRKTSRVQSHEMKEVLYSNLVQANQEEQQRLRGTIKETDELIKDLDNCIHELETELAAVEEKGFEDKPSLKSRQEDMKKVTEALADEERQISELEMQTKQNTEKTNRLKAETRNLESQLDMLELLNEWKFGGKRDNCTTYSFLHETFHLQLVFDESNDGNDDKMSAEKISRITFEGLLDEEESWDHAGLVHRLVSQYVQGAASWEEKYPTSQHVPMLLHDVSLVVSHCRLLGNELRLLEMWGGLRFDILDISCSDTRVAIVFSSLKKMSKFEVVFAVSLSEYRYVLGVLSFNNILGGTTVQQIEEVVASFCPQRDLLTKVVKRLHEQLLS